MSLFSLVIFIRMLLSQGEARCRARHSERLETSMPANTYMRPNQLAKELTVSIQTLARWRVEGNGPRFMKAGQRVLYAVDDVNDWLAKSSRQSTSEAA